MDSIEEAVSSFNREEFDAGMLKMVQRFERAFKKSEKPEREILHLFDYFNAEKSPDAIAIIFEDGSGRTQSVTYCQVNDVANLVEHQLQQLGICSGFIYISIRQKYLQPSVQIGVMRIGCAFFSLGDGNWEDSISSINKILNSRILVVDETYYTQHQRWIANNSTNQHFIEVVFCGISEVLVIIEFKQSPKGNHIVFDPPDAFEFAYGIRTSGTTGEKKLVLVPHSCIIPNIQDFIGPVWKLKQEDVIFGFAPFTFDPSVIELFTAFGCSGRILYVSDDIKLDGRRLGTLFLKHRVSVLQLTPSFLRKCGKDLKSAGVFDPLQTHVKVLALGGEKCLSKDEIKDLISSQMYGCLRRIVNLYGLTEVSCWASYGLINPYNECKNYIKSEGCNLSETTLLLSFDDAVGVQHLSEIRISSPTRVCTVIDGTNGRIETSAYITEGQPRVRGGTRDFTLKTGDFGYCHKHGLEYVGRLDNIIKKNGLKMPLYCIEEMAMASKQILHAHCANWNSSIVLIVVLKETFSTVLDLGRKVRAKLVPGLMFDIAPQFYPEFIIAVHSIPLTDNGKIDIKNIIQYISSHRDYQSGRYNLQESTIIQAITPLWINLTRPNGGVNVHFRKSLLKENFFAAGGDSFRAAFFLENCFVLLNVAGTQLQETLEPILYRRLFVATFGSICRLLANGIKTQPLQASIGLVSCEMMSSFKAFSSDNHNYGLNSNRSPAFIDRTLSDFEKNVVTFDTEERLIASSITSEHRSTFTCKMGLRMCVDARAVITSVKGICSAVAILGSHSGHIIAVDLIRLRALIRRSDRQVLTNGGVIWTSILPGRVEADVVFNSEASYVFVGCHDKAVYKLSTSDGSICGIFSCKGAVRSKPAVASSYVAIIDDADNLYCLLQSNMTVLWTKKILGGVMSTSAPGCSNCVIFVTTVTSGLLAYSVKDGRLEWPNDGVEVESKASPVVLSVGGTEQVVLLTRDGAEGRTCHSGDVLWRFHEPGVWGKSNQLFMPQVHRCQYNSTVELLITSGSGKIICVDLTGKKRCEVSSGYPTNVPSTSLCTRATDNAVICYCVTNSHDDGYLLHALEDGSSESLTVHSRMNYEIFSIPCTFNELFIFGGRDNNLHVTSLDYKLNNAP